MTVSSLVDGVTWSQNYHVGRLRKIRGLCYHTAQCPTEVGRAEFIMRFLSPSSIRASAHYAVDQQKTWAGVHEEDTAWAAPSFNADGIHIETAAFAEYGSGAIPTDTKYHQTWHDYYNGVWPTWYDENVQRMVNEKLVPLSVDICRRNDLPPVLLTPQELQNPNAKGITHHIWCTEAFGGSHWDCGPHFPLAQTVLKVANIMLGDEPFEPLQVDEDHMHLFKEKGSEIVWLVRNGRKIKLDQAYKPAQGVPGFSYDWETWRSVYLPELFKSGQLLTDPSKPLPEIGWQAMFLIPNEV